VNLFEATISHLIPLIVNELNLATVYYIWKWETPWIHWYIFLTRTLFIQFLLRSRLFHHQRIELCPRIYILQLESRDSVTYVHIQTYFWPYHCSINSFHVQRVLSPDWFRNLNHDNILSFLFTRQIILLTHIFRGDIGSMYNCTLRPLIKGLTL
jgi:hypothetical protein